MSEAGSLRDSAYSGGRWMGIQNIGLQLLTLVTTAVLARILTPADFGLVAVVTVVVGLFSLVNRAGWGAALVVRDEVTEEAVSSAFWASLGLGALTAAAAAGLAGPVASLFGSPDAADLIRGISLVLLFGQPAGVARSLLTRDLRYRALSFLALSQQVVYALVAIILAAGMGFGVWSIIIGRVAAVVSGLLFALVVARPPLGFRFERQEFLFDLRFNAGYLGSQVVSYLGKNIDYWGVGRFLGVTALGTYYVAYTVPDLVRRRATGVIQQTLFPLFARLSAERSRLGRAYGETVGKLMMTLGPFLVGFAVVARPLILAVFGQQWEQAISPSRIVAIAALFGVVVTPAVSVFTAIGRPHLAAAVSGIRLAVIATLLLPAGRLWGTSGVAAAVLVGSLVGATAAVTLLRRALAVSRTSLLKPLLPSMLPLIFLAAVVTFGSSAVAGWPEYLQLSVLVPLGAVAYLGMGLLLHRRSFKEVLRDLASVVGLR